MGKDAPDAPEPVDPRITARAQTESNEATARLEAQLGMSGSYGPGGSITYRADPNAPSGYSQYTELSPEQRAIYDQSAKAQAGALGVANNQIGRIDTALGKTLTSPDLIEGYQPGRPVNYSFDSGGTLARSFNPGQGVQYDVGPQDLEAARDETIDSEFGRAMSRLNPQFDKQNEKEQVRLANQGFSANSTGYKDAQAEVARGQNDARDLALSSAIRAGNDEAGRLFDQSVTQGAFRNAAAGQDYQQNLGMAAFGNDATMSDYDRNMGMAGFSNTASAQEAGQNADAANFTNNARQMRFSNDAYARSQPIQDFAMLMGTGGQAQMPAGYTGPTPGVAATDVLGAYALNSQERMNAYNAKVANVNAKNQAMANMVGAGLGMFSFGG